MAAVHVYHGALTLVGVSDMEPGNLSVLGAGVQAGGVLEEVGSQGS